MAQFLRPGQGRVIDRVTVFAPQHVFERGQGDERLLAEAVARAELGREGQGRVLQFREVVLMDLLVGAQGGPQELLFLQVIAAGDLQHRVEQGAGPVRLAGHQAQHVGRFQAELGERKAPHRGGGQRRFQITQRRGQLDRDQIVITLAQHLGHLNDLVGARVLAPLLDLGQIGGGHFRLARQFG